jgi:hypothetical protein
MKHISSIVLGLAGAAALVASSCGVQGSTFIGVLGALTLFLAGCSAASTSTSGPGADAGPEAQVPLGDSTPPDIGLATSRDR